MSKNKSSITTQIKNLNGKYFHAYYHGKFIDLNIDDMKKNKPSLSDMWDIMRETMCKLPKKSFLTRHSYKRVCV